MRKRESEREPGAWAAANRSTRDLKKATQSRRSVMGLCDHASIQAVGFDTKHHTEISSVSRWSLSGEGLLEAASKIFLIGSKAFLVLMLSVMCALLFCYIRGLIQAFSVQSYKNYVIWLDTCIFGLLPCIWIQEHFRNNLLDIFMRGIWFSYAYVLIFGSSIIFALRGQVQRHVLSIIFTFSFGLIIHYLIPTEPPWMAVNGVIRVHGDYISSMDMNPVAAMPSIHQAIICLAACALWQYGALGRLVGISYNMLMAISLLYLGEHFFADSVAGMVIAILSWLIAGQVLPACKEGKKGLKSATSGPLEE